MLTLIFNPDKTVYASVLIYLFAVYLLVTGTNLHAQEQTDKDLWEAFVPPPDKYDWVQLTSGEWLKGKIKVLYLDVLEFDSDELDLLKLDMEDVKQIRGAGIKSILLEAPTTKSESLWQKPESMSVSGELTVTENRVIITSEDLQKTYDRSNLIAIVSGKGNESDYWSAKVSVGIDLTGGNTEKTDYSVNMDIRRRTEANRFVLNYLGIFSRTQGTNTEDSNRLNSYFDIFRSRQFYWRPVFYQYFRDPFQNIESQHTLGTGIGYQVIKTPNTEWDINLGLAYRHTRFNSVEAGQDPTASTPALAVGTQYETSLTKSVDLDVIYNFYLINSESGKYTHHFVTTLETEITSWLDFDISFVWDRIEKPTANADGSIPEPDDYRLMFSLAVDY